MRVTITRRCRPCQATRQRVIVSGGGWADRAVALRPDGGSVVDACVAEVALGIRGGAVTVLTSDLTDIPRLLQQASGTAAVHRI